MKTKTLFVGFALGVATCVLMSLTKRIVFPTALQALPFGASSIKEETYTNGFLPDFSYKLEAKIEPHEFEGFVRRMRFPASSRRSSFRYVLEVPSKEYQMAAEYDGGNLRFEEWKH